MVAAQLKNRLAESKPSDWMSFAKVAKRLGCHVGTVWRYYLNGVRGHRLESYLIGGKRVTEWRLVEDFLQKINTPADGAPSAPVKSDHAKQAAREKSALMAALG